MVDIVEFVRSTVEPMARSTFPFITSIVGIINEHGGEYVGTGFRCFLGGRRCLVTAAHVIEQANNFDGGAGFAVARAVAPSRLSRTPDFVDTSLDLAVYFLPDEVQTGEGIDFFPESRIERDEEIRSHDYLFVHGFPGRRSRFIFGELHMRSLPYGVMERDDDLPADKKACEFAMDYDPNEMLALTGGQVEFVQAPGLSGSPVFRIGASRIAPDKWSPERCMLVGVVTRWNDDKRVLLATGAQFLLNLAGCPR